MAAAGDLGQIARLTFGRCKKCQGVGPVEIEFTDHDDLATALTQAQKLSSNFSQFFARNSLDFRSRISCRCAT